MKVLLVNGSPHEKGNTHAALTLISETLKSEGVESDIFWVGTKPISGCLGCWQCAGKGKCIIEDRVNECLAIANDYDGFVFGTPVHWAGAGGALTSFMDRLFYAGLLNGGMMFRHKPAAAISTARRAGTTATWDQLNKYFGLMQMPITTSSYWNFVIGGRPPATINDDAEGLGTMRVLSRNMAFMLKCKEAGLNAGIPLPTPEPPPGPRPSRVE